MSANLFEAIFVSILCYMLGVNGFRSQNCYISEKTENASETLQMKFIEWVRSWGL